MPDGKKFRFGNVLLCGYATVSENRKYTLVNIYAGEDVLVSGAGGAAGALLFGFYAELMGDDTRPPEVEVEVHVNDTMRVKMGFSVVEPATNKTTVLLMQAFPIPFADEGDVKFTATAKGYEPMVIMRKRIKINPTLQPTASPPPS